MTVQQRLLVAISEFPKVRLCRKRSALWMRRTLFWVWRELVPKAKLIVQAEVAGSNMHIAEEKIKKVEYIVDEIEKVLPPIKTFFISGATKDGAVLDITRTLVRRAERRVIAAKEEGKITVNANTLQYLNRLSSLLYALARIASQGEGKEEVKPSYK
jgi:ATP:cob(I)alamin adenosyltransferase